MLKIVFEENFEYQKFVSEDTLNNLWKVRKEWSKIIKINKFKKVEFG